MTVTIPIIAADGTQSIVTLPRATAFLPKYGGGLCYTWERVIGNVWISVEDRIIDGRIWRCAPAMHYSEPSGEGIDPGGGSPAGRVGQGADFWAQLTFQSKAGTA